LIGELAIGASAEGRGSVADTAESTAAGAPSAGSKSRDEPEDGAAPEAAPGPDKASFDNTRKHVAERAAGTPDAARFAHTKQSQAAPSGGDEVPPGARFAMTNRQAGRSGEASPPRPEVVTVGAGEAPVEIRIDHDGRKAPARPAAAAPQAPPATPAGQNGRAAAPPQGLPPAEPAPSKVPVESSKTFVGSNGTYYDEAWRWMDWRGQRHSWNWPAALTFGHWLAYRRLYWAAAFYLLWLGLLIGAAVNGVPLPLVAGAQLVVALLGGLYANTLYLQVFRGAVAHVTEKGEGDYAALKAQLAAAGGVDQRAVGVMAGLALAMAAVILLATAQLNGGLEVNLIWY
jgi:hypothetical protein